MAVSFNEDSWLWVDSRWNVSGWSSRTTVPCSCPACTPHLVCSPGWIMPPVIQTTSNWGDSHLYHDAKNTRAHKRYTLFLPLLHGKNNEPAHRAGNFTDLTQSKVPAFKSLVMQMTTSCFLFTLMCILQQQSCEKYIFYFSIHFSSAYIKYSLLRFLSSVSG